MIQSDQLRHLIHFEVLKRKGVSEEKVGSNDCLANQNDAKESEGAWYSFHCVMDLEAISSTYPQPTDFCFLLFCFLDENDGAECNERRRASQNRNAQRCFVHQATSFVFLPFGVEVCQSIHREAFCLILLFVFNPPYKSTPHSPRNNAISFKNKDRNGNWIFSLPYNAHTTHIVFLLKHSKLRL